MRSETPVPVLRRSSRIPAELPIMVTTLAGTHFSEVCKTLVVSAHGCALQTPIKFDTGVPLKFHSNDGRETTAHVVSCLPIGPDNRLWKLGAKLDKPVNFWRLGNCPEDWKILKATISNEVPRADLPANALSQTLAAQAGQTLEAKLDLVAQRLEAPLKRLIAESLGPIEAQVAAIKQNVARREANPSRFEVSLSSIPPELEQQLEARIRKDLEPRVLQEARQQYEKLLEDAKSAIARRTTEGYESFLQKVSEQLKLLEKRAQEHSASIAATTDEHFHRGLKDFHQRLLDGGNSLKRLSEELLEFQQNNLNVEYNARREDLEKLGAAVVSQSSILRQAIEALESRIDKLDASARSLESGLDQRLGLMSSNVIKETRSQLESTAGEVLGQLAEHSASTIEGHLEQAGRKLENAKKDAIDSCSESLKHQTADDLQVFERSIDELARLNIEQWRLKLSASLSVIAKNLGEPI